MNSFEVDSTFGGDADANDDRTGRLSDHHVFTDDDFKTPDTFVRQLEALERKGTFSVDHHSATRKSLLRNFDPLVDASNDSFIQKFNNMALNESRTRLETNGHNVSSTQSQSFFENHNESTTLLKFNSPLPLPPKISSSPRKTNDQNDGNCDLLGQDLPSSADELSLQEKLIEKDQQILDLQFKLDTVEGECQKFETMVNLLHQCNQQVVEMAAEVIDSLVADKNELVVKCNELNAERTQAVEELSNVEKNFYEIHNRYDKVRTAVEEFKQKEEQFKEQIMELMDRLNEKEEMYEILKSKAEQKIEDANTYIESARKECESEMIAVKAQLKRSEMKINGLQTLLDQKTKENDELTKMVDELIANVEK